MADNTTTTTETTEYSDGTTIETVTETTVSDPIGESEPAIIEGEVEAIADVVEPAIDASVAIAEIEAERDITIAAIEADTATELAAHEREDTEWQRNIETQLSSLTTTVTEIAATLASLIPPPSEQAPNPPNPPKDVEVDPPAAEPERVAPEQVSEPPAKVKRSRWI